MYFKLKAGKRIFIQDKAIQFMVVILFISIGVGIYDGIISLYLENILKNPSLVGFVSALIIMIMFFTYMFLTQMYSKYPVTNVWLISTLAMAISLFLLYFFQNFLIFAILIGIFVVSLTLYNNTTAIILRHSTTLESIGKIQGFYYVAKNIGFVLGPLLSSYVLYKFGLFNNFLMIGLFIFIGWLFFLYFHIKAYEENKPQTITLKTIHQNIVDYFKNKELFKLYFIRGAISFYWAIIYIFTPLFILSKGISASLVGVFLGVLALPLIITQFLIAKKIDLISKKKLFIIGTSLISLFLFISFFFNNVYLTLLFVFFSVIGAAILEPSSEAYFFLNVNQFVTDRYYGVYRTSESLFSLFSRLFFGFILLFLKIKYIYLLTALFYIIIIYVATKVEK